MSVDLVSALLYGAALKYVLFVAFLGLMLCSGHLLRIAKRSQVLDPFALGAVVVLLAAIHVSELWDYLRAILGH